MTCSFGFQSEYEIREKERQVLFYEDNYPTLYKSMLSVGLTQTIQNFVMLHDSWGVSTCIHEWLRRGI
jgi:hypothetical protein